MGKNVKVVVLIVAIILVAVLIDGCSSLHPKRIPYHTTESSRTGEDWTIILRHTPKIDSFKLLNTGSVKVPLDGMLNVDKLDANHGFDEFLWVDVFAFLFHHQELGWHMVDSGLDSSFQENGNIWGALAGKFIKGTKQTPGQNIAAQLAKENKIIKGIFLTHLHGDHTSGLPEIEKNIPKYIGKGEKHFNIPFLYRSNHLNYRDTLIELDWEKGQDIAPLNSAIDVFGDGSFWAIHTPGHSNSHLSYLLITADGPILLTGDASHTKYGFENQIEPGWVDDQVQAANSLKQLIQLKKQFPIIHVIYGHEQ